MNNIKTLEQRVGKSAYDYWNASCHNQYEVALQEEIVDLRAALASQASKGAGVPIAYAVFGISSGKHYLKSAKPIKDDEWKSDDDCLGDYWAGNEALVIAAPSPAQAKPSVEDKALFWLDCLSKCAKLLELSEDTPIPSGVVAAVEKLVAAKAQPVASQSDDAEMQTIRDRDYNADIADKLAYAIGEHLGRDVDEHSSGHCPWLAALEMLNEAQPVDDSVQGDDHVLTREELADYRKRVLDEGISIGRAAGIEEAAKWIDYYHKPGRREAEAIRALATKPA